MSRGRMCPNKVLIDLSRQPINEPDETELVVASGIVVKVDLDRPQRCSSLSIASG
jgi:hypothetical protein